MVSLNLIPHQLDDLGVICDLDQTVLRRIQEHLSSQNSILRPRQMIHQIVEVAEDRLDDEEIESIVRLTISLRGIVRRLRLDPQEFTIGLRQAVNRDSDWEPERKAKWPEVEPLFFDLVWSNPARMISNAIELSYDYANLYRSGRIITDIRPLFTDDASAIEGAVISFTLRLHYDSDDASHEISVAMDEMDVDQLFEQCERALTKAKTAKLKIEESIPAFITGSEDDD